MQAVTIGRAAGLARVRSGDHVLRIPVWAIKLYELHARKRDGVYVWKLVESWRRTSGRWPSLKMHREALAYAEENGIPFKEGLKQWQEADLTDVELLALSTSGMRAGNTSEMRTTSASDSSTG